MILEQGLTLDVLAQGESGGPQPPPTAGALWRTAVPTSSEFSDLDAREYRG